MSVFQTSGVQHVRKFLERIRESGLTLNIKKCSFAQSEVKFCGQMIGSGTRRADKVAAVRNMKVPETTKEDRQMLRFLPRCMECKRGLAIRILSVCLSVRPSVRPSVTHVNCDKTVERSVEIYIPYERSFSLVF